MFGVDSRLALVALVLLLTGCGTAGEERNRCDSPGKVYVQRVLVEREGEEKLEMAQLFLVCRPSGYFAIVDSKGGSYDNLDDFRANNEIFSADDRITLPPDFPSTKKVPMDDWVTVSGHTRTPWEWWLGGVLGSVLLVGGGLWLFRRRQVRTMWPDEG